MRTTLDERMDATMAALTGPGGMLALGEAERGGRRYPIIAAAPPALPHYFAHYCHEHADKTFLVAGDERLTFADVYAAARAVAGALVATHRVAKGDRVGIAMRNSPSWIVLYMGILMAGGVATLLNGWWQAEELAAAIDEVEARLVFADGPRAQRLAGSSAQVVAIDDTLPLAVALGAITAAGGEEAALPNVAGTDHATILFTSGSTGRSKGAIADHRGVVQGTFNYLAQALMMLGLATQDGNPPTEQPSTLLTLPLFHVTAEVPVMLQSFAMGRKLVLMRKWDAVEAMRLIQAERISYFVGVPLMSFEILTHPDRASYDLSTVTDFAAGGAPRPVEHVRRIDAEMGGSAPLIGYGLTETNGIGTGNWRSNYLAKPDSAGRASAPLVDLAILDDDGAPVPQGARGEIAIRSIANFLGYWNRPEATAACMTADGYFRTGDIGYLDADGYLFIVDRIKDMILCGGYNVYPRVIEEALYEHPAVVEAVVIGVPDAHRGQAPKAFVVLSEPGSVTGADLRDFLRDKISKIELPREVEIRDSLPKTLIGKLSKKELVEEEMAKAAR